MGRALECRDDGHRVLRGDEDDHRGKRDTGEHIVDAPDDRHDSSKSRDDEEDAPGVSGETIPGRVVA